MDTNFKVIGLTRLGFKPESAAPKADALTNRSSELSYQVNAQITLYQEITGVKFTY